MDPLRRRWTGALAVALASVAPACQDAAGDTCVEDSSQASCTADSDAEVTGSTSDSDASSTSAEDTGTTAMTTATTATTGEPAPPLEPRFELDAGDFFRSPWPSDLRTFEDGTVDLHDFPNAEHAFVAQLREALEHVLVGFSTTPVVYLQLDRDPGEDALISVHETLKEDGAVQLLDVSPEGCGARTPALMQLDVVGDAYTATPLLEITPVEGFPLRQRTTYALVVLRSFGASVGLETARPAAFDGALTGTHDDPRVNEVYAPLRACLEPAGLVAEDIAVATVFTTQDPVGELRELTAFVHDPDSVPTPVVTEAQSVFSAGRNALEGRFDVPIFQHGVSPYVTGGGFAYDDEGTPLIARWESAPFLLTIPDGEPPFPVMIWQDGTGWSEWGHAEDAHTIALLEQGVAVFAFMPQFHGSRATPGSEPNISTYNYLNAVAGRTNLRQQSLEVSYAIRLLRESMGGLPHVDELDTARLLYGGHSQGCIPGSMLAAVEDEFLGYVLSSGTSYLSITIAERKDYDIQGMLKAILGVDRDVDRYHPIAQMAQLGAGPVEPHNYAVHWRGSPERPAGADVFITNGLLDYTTHPIGMAYMTISADSAPIEPATWEPDPYDVWARAPEPMPIAGNRVGFDGAPYTVATYMDPFGGHFVFQDEPEARAIGVHFLSSAAAGAPTISPP